MNFIYARWGRRFNLAHRWGISKSLFWRVSHNPLLAGPRRQRPAPVSRLGRAPLHHGAHRIGAVYPATVKSNFSSIARGGLTTGYTFLSCYADFTVAEYLLGYGTTGTSNNLTVAYNRMGESRSYDLYKLAHTGGEFGSESLMSEA